MFEKRSIGIAFEADGTVRAVELTSNLRTVSLTGAWSFPPEGGESFDSWRQALEALQASGVGLDNVVIGVPDSLVYRKQLTFPFSGRRRITQILGSELDGEIPIPVDEVVAEFVPGRSTGPGTRGTAMACDRATLSRFLEMAGSVARLKGVQTGSVGLAAAAVRAGVTDGVCVHCGPGEAVLVELRESRIETVKRLALGGGRERDLESLSEAVRLLAGEKDEVYIGCADRAREMRASLAGEEDFRIRVSSPLDAVHGTPDTAAGADLMPALGLALAGLGAREAILFDLRQGPFKQVTPLAGLKVPIMRTSALLLLVAFLGAAGLVTGLNQARAEYQDLKGRLETRFRELFPGSRIIEGQEVAQIRGQLDGLEKKITELSGLEGRGALSVLASLSAAIPEDVSLKLDELSYDSNKLRIEGSVTSFDTVDRVKSLLESDPLFSEVQVQNARVGADINKVTFRLQMEVR